MNPDNPYAAPQTIDLRTPCDVPVAEHAGRNLFPDVSTSELSRLALHSKAIDAMSLIWAIGFIFSVSGLYLGHQWYWLVAIPLAGMRMWTGNSRPFEFWTYNLIMDVIVTLVLLGVIVIGVVKLSDPQSQLPPIVALGLPVVIVFIFALFSVVAHLSGKVLYGNYPHRDLIAEVAYRKRNRVA